jgi:hypothetical protein
VLLDDLTSTYFEADRRFWKPTSAASETPPENVQALARLMTEPMGA